MTFVAYDYCGTADIYTTDCTRILVVLAATRYFIMYDRTIVPPTRPVENGIFGFLVLKNRARHIYRILLRPIRFRNIKPCGIFLYITRTRCPAVADVARANFISLFIFDYSNASANRFENQKRSEKLNLTCLLNNDRLSLLLFRPCLQWITININKNNSIFRSKHTKNPVATIVY